MTYEQSNFLGGLDARFDSLRAGGSTYPLMVNGRVRQNAVEAVARPLQDTALPQGNYQAITAVGSVLIVFVSGAAWYRDTESTDSWRQVTGLALDASVDVIDTCDLPASTINYARTGPIDLVKFNNSPARATDEGILATDGINQPYLLYPEAGGIISARPTFTYAQWLDTPTGELREYVPVGRYPIFVGQKLYMAIEGSAGVLNRIAQSVTGRPLDFVVAINDTDGDKAGDALTTAHAVGFDPITGLYRTSTEAAFIVGTANNVFAVTPDYTNTTFFGEPALRNSPLFPVGVLNNKSAVDLNGDSGFITPTGIHSFNATMQTRFQSNNDPISVQVHKLLAPVQTFGATADFENYAFFAVDTVFGPGVMVFDKTLSDQQRQGMFVSVDLYDGIGQIKQYARTSAPSGNRLFFITADNRLFEFGAADTRETCRYYIGEWNSSTGKVVQNFRRAFAVFSGVFEDTTVQFRQFADGVEVDKAAFTVSGAAQPSAPVIPLPHKVTVGPANAVVQYEASSAPQCFAVGTFIEWNTAARLVFATLETDSQALSPANLSQMALATVQPAPRRFALVGDTQPGAVLDAIMRLPEDTVVIGLGDFLYGTVPLDDYNAYTQTIGRLQAQGRWFAVAGEVDFDHDSGLVVFNKLTNGKRYAKYTFGPDIEIFFYNVGWDTATLNTQPPPFEPDGNNVTSQQAQWLRASLAESTARFKFVVLHECPYSDGNFAPGYTALRLPYKAWGATAVFCAHDHNYQRFIIDGLNYILVGTGGVGHMAIGATHQTGYQAGRDDVFGYLSLEIDPFNASIQFNGVDDSTFDQFVIGT